MPSLSWRAAISPFKVAIDSSPSAIAFSKSEMSKSRPFFLSFYLESRGALSSPSHPHTAAKQKLQQSQPCTRHTQALAKLAKSHCIRYWQNLTDIAHISPYIKLILTSNVEIGPSVERACHNFEKKVPQEKVKFGVITTNKIVIWNIKYMIYMYY